MLVGMGCSSLDLFDFATKNTPCLFIDCANVANPHRIPTEDVDWDNLFVLEVELIYVFRDVIRDLKRITPQKKVVISNFQGLFHYQNEKENKEIIRHAWELLKEHSKEFDIFIGIKSEEDNAKLFCDEIRMGHTVWSQRIVIDSIIGELRAYAKALRKEDREIFEEIIREPLKHLGSISYANSMHAWAFLIISMIIELKKNGNRCLSK